MRMQDSLESRGTEERAYDWLSPDYSHRKLRRLHEGGLSSASIIELADNSVSHRQGEFRKKDRSKHRSNTEVEGVPYLLGLMQKKLKRHLVEAIGKMVMANNQPEDFGFYIKENEISACESDFEDGFLEQFGADKERKFIDNDSADDDFEDFYSSAEKNKRENSDSLNQFGSISKKGSRRKRLCNKEETFASLRNMMKVFSSKNLNKTKANKTSEEEKKAFSTSRPTRRHQQFIRQHSAANSVNSTHSMSNQQRRKRLITPMKLAFNSISGSSSSLKVATNLKKPSLRAEFIMLFKAIKTIRKNFMRSSFGKMKQSHDAGLHGSVGDEDLQVTFIHSVLPHRFQLQDQLSSEFGRQVSKLSDRRFAQR